jgi:predicted PurR-regulated permease PerM
MPKRLEKLIIEEKAESNLAAVIRRQMIFWLAAAIVLTLFLWVFREILLPFIAGMALAYFLDPVADRLEKWGASRMLATSIILVLFILVFIIALMIIVPVLGNQLTGFIDRLPSYIARLQALIATSDSPWIKRIVGEGGQSIQNNLNEVMKEGASWLSALLQQLWSSGKAVVDIISLFVITPVVAFYLLYDWDRMVAQIDDWLPRDHKDTIREITGDINSAIAGFVRGQGTLCLILGLFYATGLTVAGLNFGLLIGLFAGFVSFIPYVGSLLGLVLSVGVALVQFWPDWMMISVIAGIFAFGQFMEGNILQPKLVGESVGLHPVWLMFALLAFGSLLGFTGLLIAVPAAAVVGVLVRFALKRYLESDLYKGHNIDADESSAD